MSKRRPGLPYIWVTWLSGLLSGEDQCHFASWFASRHSYKARPREGDDFDLNAWRQTHNEMVQARAKLLEAAGFTVYIEGQNEFRIDGRRATLSGKPDIVAVLLSDVLVVDCKSGKRRDKDLWQVFLYLFAYSIFRHHGIPAGAVIRGEVEYQDGSLPVPASTFTAERRAEVVAKVEQVAAADAPRQIGSHAECRFCDVPDDDCPSRVKSRAITTTEVF